MYVLAGTFGDRFVELTLKMGRHRIGRGARNDLDLEDLSVSREHAELMVSEGRIRIQDLGSSNGTWINDRKVTESVELHPGDELRIGALKFTLLGGSTAAARDDISSTDPEMPSAVMADQKTIATEGILGRSETSDALNLVSVFDQVLFRAVTEAGQLLVMPRPLNEIFDAVLGLVESVIPARRIFLLLTDTPDGSPIVRAARPRGAAERESLVLSHSIIGSVLKDRQALLLNDAMSDPRFRSQDSVIRQNIRGAMVAPLFDNEDVIGILYADNDDVRFHYDKNQLRAFTLLANLIAVKITNTRLLAAQRDNERMEREVAAAAQVQQGLLLISQPPVAGYEIVARQVPCFEVAGDLYDITQLDDGRVGLVVGDVTGKGMGAAMLMSNTLAALRVLYQECPEISVMAERLHRQLLRACDDVNFTTMFLGILDPQNHRLEYVNAGHNPPMLLCSEDECVELGPTGLPMGLIEGASYKVKTVDLPSCCMLCVFTDGITEAQAHDTFYGEERLLRSIRKRCHAPLQEIVDGVILDLRDFLGDNMLQDDVTMLLMRRHE